MSRTEIFSKIRKVNQELTQKADYPEYDVTIMHSQNKLQEPDSWKCFAANFHAVNGKAMESISELIDFLKNTNQLLGYCDPNLFDDIGLKLQEAGLTVETEYHRDRYEEYTFGITRASGAIAESGSLILDDFLTSSRLAALSPWVHIGVLTKEEIHRTIPDAIASFGDAPNIIWCTGPSKTADVEGILIEGVHGPGEQIALLLQL